MTERREPYNYEISELGSHFHRFVCLVCGRAWEHYPVDEPCEEFVRASHLDNVIEWAEPGVRIRRFRSRACSAREWLEVTISGTHEPETPSRESSADPEAPTSSKDPLDLREQIERDKPDWVEIIWAEDLPEEDQVKAFVLPGWGWPTGEKPPQSGEDGLSGWQFAHC